jgi:DNA polymerase (family 10)
VDNRTIAKKFFDYANYLETREGNLYRVRAYRRAADTLLALDRPAREILAAEGRRGLETLPGIGRHLSYTIDSLVSSGEFRTLESSGGHIDPE